ncbi:MAG: hypothetical protein RR373_00350 [Akkermansia sp.]
MINSIKDRSHIYTPILAFILIILAFVQIFISFNGLNQPFAMDQAQIAREVSRGNGMNTKFIRPLALANWTKSSASTKTPTFEMKDSNHAPLNIMVQAAALTLAGGNDFDSWKMDQTSMVYGLDRIIAGTSLLFFMISVVVIFNLTQKLFDYTIACVTSALLIINDTFLQFSTSGLPQMMMLLFCTLGISYLYDAIHAQKRKESFLAPLIYSGIFFALLPLSNWVGIWLFLGALIFVGSYFRPFGRYCLPFGIFLLLGMIWPIYQNMIASGNPFGTALFSLFGTLSGSEDTIMRSLSPGGLPLNGLDLFLAIITRALPFIQNIIANMGGLIIVPFFFLGLFHRYKKPELNALKIAILCIWTTSIIGMAMYSSPTDAIISPVQLQIIIAPLFAAFGMSILFIMVSRLTTKKTITGINGFVIGLVLFISSGSILLRISDTIKSGLSTSDLVRVNWPPYNPFALNGQLREATEMDTTKLIATDQPWAVAWYTDQNALWLPKSIDTFTTIDKTLAPFHSDITGILITPSSRDVDPDTITANYGDFTPYVLDGTILELSANNPVNIIAGSPTLESIQKKFAGSNSRLFLMGLKMIYYSSHPIKASLLN